MAKFPWLSFLIQAPQALENLTGYGMILGAYMGFLTDVTWAAIRAPVAGFPRIVGPPPSDPIMKAVRYMSQPPFHYRQSQLIHRDDHQLLLAADMVASWLLRENFSVNVLTDRIAAIDRSPVIQYEPWHPGTIEVLRADGWAPGMVQRPPVVGLDEFSTYEDVLGRIVLGFGDWFRTFAVEPGNEGLGLWFPQTLSDAGQENLIWLNGGENPASPEFSPAELLIAHLFDWGIFPPGNPTPAKVGEFIDRALGMAAAVGRTFPGPRQAREAMVEVFGGFVTS